jgi:mitochondrial division protein 1
MLSAASPSELLRTTLSPSDISFRQITYLPDELLYDIPETGDSALSLFQGFRASLPDAGPSMALRKGSKAHPHHRRGSKPPAESLTEAQRLQKERDNLIHDMEILTIRKSLASTEISEIDSKVQKLTLLRSEFLEKLEKLETQEANLEHEGNVPL